MNQELAEELLLGEGILVTTAKHGKEALEALKKKPFDCILMDCQMPVMDGYEATLKIREQKEFQQLPILAMTANAMAGDKEQVLSVGMNDHIAKPIDPILMFETIAKWVKPTSRTSIKKPKNKQTEKTQALYQLKGIDAKRGLRTTMNKEDLYRRLLKKFYDDQQDFEQQFRQCLNKNDIESATRLAHSLKGISANLGMTDLKNSAAKLEKGFKEDSANIEAQLHDMVLDLKTVLKSLKKIQ
ncbi:MAG: response regulator [Gammaproteobacteria bacterium]|nr:response regulator [Gammaproteobacteria bacterium]